MTQLTDKQLNEYQYPPEFYTSEFWQARPQVKYAFFTIRSNQWIFTDLPPVLGKDTVNPTVTIWTVAKGSYVLHTSRLAKWNGHHLTSMFTLNQFIEENNNE